MSLIVLPPHLLPPPPQPISDQLNTSLAISLKVELITDSKLSPWMDDGLSHMSHDWQLVL